MTDFRAFDSAARQAIRPLVGAVMDALDEMKRDDSFARVFGDGEVKVAVSERSSERFKEVSFLGPDPDAPEELRIAIGLARAPEIEHRIAVEMTVSRDMSVDCFAYVGTTHCWTSSPLPATRDLADNLKRYVARELLEGGVLKPIEPESVGMRP